MIKRRPTKRDSTMLADCEWETHRNIHEAIRCVCMNIYILNGPCGWLRCRTNEMIMALKMCGPKLHSHTHTCVGIYRTSQLMQPALLNECASNWVRVKERRTNDIYECKQEVNMSVLWLFLWYFYEGFYVLK